MTIHFLPDVYTRATKTTVVIPVSDTGVLTDPSNGRVVIPARVEIILQLIEGAEGGSRTSVHVAVTGPRRLKSGSSGRPITTFGWESARNEGYGSRGYVARPGWLTELLAEHLPMGWDPALLDLPEVAA